MKNNLYSISAFLLSVLFLDESSCNRQAAASSGSRAIYPLNVGNYWVYKDSTFSEGKLVSTANDTDKIVRSGEWNGKTTFIFDDGREWFSSGDTIYQLGKQRTGAKFPSPVMMATEKESKFNSMFGGDVAVQKKIEKLSSCPENKWEPSACYKISDTCDGYMINGYGVGILREKTTECFSGNNNYITRTLINVYLQ
jgi:hypothetical protein